MNRSVFYPLTLLWLWLAIAAQAAVVIDEIRPWSGPTGLEDLVYNRVELYNSGPGPVDLEGWTLGSEIDGDAQDLPAWVLPAGAWLTLHFEAGSDDSDFGDNQGHFHLLVPTFAFQPGAGEVGLYSGEPADSTLVDFVRWGLGSSSNGNASAHALASGQWPAGEHVEMAGFSAFAHLGRIPSGYDTDQPSDWLPLEQSLTVVDTAVNPIQVAPYHQSLHAEVSELAWQLLPDAAMYTLEVDDDPAFGSPEFSQQTAGNSLPVALGDGLWFWRVTPDLSGGPHPAAVFWFVAEGDLALRQWAVSAVPQRFQHKDTGLLCLYSNQIFRPNPLPPIPPHRGGCFEGAGGQGPWDAAHPATAAHIPGCRHCSQYCTRASIQMVNHRYGGTLTQDEISYKLRWNDNPGPELDLGHNIGAWPQGNLAYSWALNGAGIAENFITPDAAIPFATLQAEIDGNHPVLAVIRPPGWFHTVVFTGYFEINIPFFGTYRFLQMTDPWPGRSGWFYHPAMPVVRYYLLPAGDVTGRMTDAHVALDFDGDGVRNFDEGLQASAQVPRNLCSSPHHADTDGDQVADKAEIRSYTFHDIDHPGHGNDAMTFPDVDGDGLRAECDCDTDNGGQFDGGEDINGNGNTPQAGETCVYDPDDDLILLVHTEVLVEECLWEVFVEGLTFHANSTYHYELQADCPFPLPGDFLAWSGTLVSDANGVIQSQSLGLFPPGMYRVVLDILDDHMYWGPDNQDPWLCFLLECEAADTDELPIEFALGSSRPNPFNPTTLIPFSLEETGLTRLVVYNTLGQQVAVLVDGLVERGHHEIVFDGTALPSGVYYCRLEAGSRVATGRILLVR